MDFYCRCRNTSPFPETHTFSDIVRVAANCDMSLNEAIHLIRMMKEGNNYDMFCNYSLDFTSDDYSMWMFPKCHSDECYNHMLERCIRSRNRCFSI